MKVTTVRFGADVWALLEHEAASAGVSVSQYIREAALARAAAAAAARGEEPLALLASLRNTPVRDARRPKKRANAARRRAAARAGDFAALDAQREQAFRHARAVTAQSEQTIGRARRLLGEAPPGD
jgi:hypothetical protein